jgi:hypothetical protein
VETGQLQRLAGPARWVGALVAIVLLCVVIYLSAVFGVYVLAFIVKVLSGWS